MQKRRLGRTGHESTVAIFGGAALWQSDQDHANPAFEKALAAGINHIDVAPQYGNAEDCVGGWLPPHRDKFFLGCKTLERARDDAWAQLQVSLEKLKTDQLDLYQLHAVTDFEQLEMAMAPGGAIEALQRARHEGLTRFLGITGHSHVSPAVQIAALERFDFDTVMFAINPTLYANPDYRRDCETLLGMCQERDVGVQIIKSVAKQPWAEGDKRYLTWYEPFDEQARINQMVRFVLSQPAVTCIPIAGDVRILPMVIEAAENFTPMPESEQAALIGELAGHESIFSHM
jgi:aryl-alcohol dehydrogenase-like predicted oxidoreductase